MTGAMSEGALVKLAVLAPGELGAEVDAAGTLDGGELRFAEGDQLGSERRGGPRRVGGDDDCFHFLAEVGIGGAEDGDVRHLRVAGENVLRLLGVDVDPARDDGERLAVGEEQVALLVT